MLLEANTTLSSTEHQTKIILGKLRTSRGTSLAVTPHSVRQVDGLANDHLDRIMQRLRGERPVRILSLGCGATIPIDQNHIGPTWEREVKRRHAERVEVVASDILDAGDTVVLAVRSDGKIQCLARSWDDQRQFPSLPQSDFDQSSEAFLPVSQAAAQPLLAQHKSGGDIVELFHLAALHSHMEAAFGLVVKHGVSILSLPQNLGKFDLVVARHLEGGNMRNGWGCEVQLDLRAIQDGIRGILHKDGLGIVNIDHRQLLEIPAPTA